MKMSFTLTGVLEVAFYYCTHFSPQRYISMIIFFKSSPFSVREYSTVVGTVGKTSLLIMLFSSNERKQFVSDLELISCRSRLNSPNRFFPENRFFRIRKLHFPPMMLSVFSTQHSAISLLQHMGSKISFSFASIVYRRHAFNNKLRIFTAC